MTFFFFFFFFFTDVCIGVGIPVNSIACYIIYTAMGPCYATWVVHALYTSLFK